MIGKIELGPSSTATRWTIIRLSEGFELISHILSLSSMFQVSVNIHDSRDSSRTEQV